MEINPGTNEEGVTSINSLTGDVILAAGTNITFTTVGQTITINSTALSSVAWGSITGTLANQTDLQAALNAKASSTASITIGSTNIVLGASSLTLAGLTSVTSTTFIGALTGNASTATALATGRTISITGDLAYTSGSFDGSANVTGTGTLASIISAGGPTGSATVAPIITYDAKGRLTAVSSATITPAVGSITGLGTGVATALGVNVGSAGAFVTFNGALGTPSSGTLTNATGLPISTGVSGLGAGIATFLGTPSSANLLAAVTDETGSGALVFGTSPTFTTGATISGTAPSLAFTDTTASAKSLTIAVDGNVADFRESAGASGSLLALDLANARVGVGTATPGYPLDVNGVVGAVSAKFGAAIPFYIIANEPTLGMNVYYNGGWKYGAGSVARYGMALQADTTNGVITFSLTSATGNADAAASITERVRYTAVGQVKIGGSAVRATTEGTSHLDIFDGTAPVGTLANGISLYSTTGELRVMDSAGNATLLSPHEKGTNYWIYDSVDSTTGKHLRIDMERAMRFLNVLYRIFTLGFGKSFIKEFYE